MSSPASSGREGRRRRRRPKRKSAPPSAAAVLSHASAEVTAEPAEVPMTPAEIARMKVTLRFLREHRHTLKLRVNAAEDLLLNGKREPTHRGLCRHLLSKLDRARVIAASERLPAGEATELMAGIVRFAPEIPYIVRFLQCVKASADPAQTAAALTQALERLDLSATSPAQLRDLLLLIVEVFPRAELPVFVFTLLDRPELRAAVARSLDALPESLAQLLGPLSALHGWIAHGPGKRRRAAASSSLAHVLEGAGLLLEAAPPSLAELPERLRRRLLELGSDARVVARGGGVAERLVALFRGLEYRDAPSRAAAAAKLAAALLGGGREKLGRQLLADGLDGAPAGEPARRWLEWLGGERVGEVALSRRRPREDKRADGGAADAKGQQEGWQRGWHVPTQRDVLVRIARRDAEALRAHAELERRALVPGLARVIAAELRPAQGTPYLAVAWHGPSLEGRLERGDLAPERALECCVEAALVLNALALSGLELPDAAPRRFSLDAGGRLWLTDLWGVRQGGPQSLAAHLELARALCRDVLDALELDPVLSRAALEAAATTEDLIAALTARSPSG